MEQTVGMIAAAEAASRAACEAARLAAGLGVIPAPDVYEVLRALRAAISGLELLAGWLGPRLAASVSRMVVTDVMRAPGDSVAICRDALEDTGRALLDAYDAAGLAQQAIAWQWYAEPPEGVDDRW